MPGPILPPELRATVSVGVRDLKAHLEEPAGRSELAALTQVRTGLTAELGSGAKPQSMKAATATLALIGDLPADLVGHAEAPLVDPVCAHRSPGPDRGRRRRAGAGARGRSPC